MTDFALYVGAFLGALIVLFGFVVVRSAPKLGILSSVYAVIFALLALGTIQGSSGPLASLKSLEVRIVFIVVLVGLGALAQFRRVSPSNPYGVHATKVSIIGLLVATFGIVALMVLMISQISSSQMLVLALYMAPIVVLGIAPKDFVVAAMVGLLCGCVVQILLAMTLGPYVMTLSGISQLSGGLQPNVIALAGIFALLFGASLILRGGTPALLGSAIALLAVISIYLTVSRTGLIVGVAALGSLLLLDGGRSARRVAVSGVMLGAFYLVAFESGRSAVEQWFIRGDESSISSLTGRTDIWSLAISLWGERPIFGWGFGALYSQGSSAGFFLHLVRGVNAHNAVLQLLVETGLTGLVLMILVLAAASLVLWRKSGRNRPLTFSILLAVLLNSIGSASFSTIGLAWSALALMIVWSAKLEVETEVMVSDRNRARPGTVRKS